MVGIGGVPQIATDAPSIVLDREMTIRFNADTDKNLPWEFNYLQKQLKLKVKL